MLRIYDEKNDLCICGFAKAGTQILQKVFNQSLGLPILSREHEVKKSTRHWVVLREHRSRVLSVFYEKQLSWHGVPNNNLKTWGNPCTYYNFIHGVLPNKIGNDHLKPYTSYEETNDIKFDRIYGVQDLNALLEDYSSLLGATSDPLIEIANKKIFHKVPYKDPEQSKSFVSSIDIHPSQLSPTEIKESRLYLRHGFMNTEEINDKIRSYYESDFERFKFLAF